MAHEGDEEAGPPGAEDDDEEEDEDDEASVGGSKAPPFSKKTYRNSAFGATLSHDDYLRHLAIISSSNPRHTAAVIKAERAQERVSTPVPVAIDALLADYELGESERASVRPCEASKFHSPRPLLTKHYDFGVGMDLWLCPVCFSNTQVFLMINEAEDLPWSTLREFGNEVRKLGNEVLRLRRQKADADG